ncbi:hypothetical protein ACOME3_006413 [Neoechinorhynchus agilis]
MRGYLMCPLLQYRDTAEQLVSVVGPCMAHDLVIEATMSALLIDFSADMVQWSLKDYGLLYTRPRINKNLNDLGYKGAVGKHLATTFSTNLPSTFLRQAKIARNFRILSYDLLGWFPTLPEGCARTLQGREYGYVLGVARYQEIECNRQYTSRGRSGIRSARPGEDAAHRKHARPTGCTTPPILWTG